jgi:hypothetical protein
MFHAADAYDVTLALHLGSRPAAVRATWITRGDQAVTAKEEGQLSESFQRELLALALLGRQRLASAAVFQEECRRLGRALWQQVMPGEIGACYKAAYEEARQSNRKLRIRLQLPPELEHLPFELLYDAEHGILLGANLFVSLVRKSPGKSFKPRNASLPLRCLVVIAHPRNVPQLNVDQEVAMLEEATSELRELGLWELEYIRGPSTLKQLRGMSQSQRFHMLHYVGHGVVDPHSGKSFLVFEGDASEEFPVDSNALLPVLSGYTNLSLLVFNSCFGARPVRDLPYASLAQELMKLELPALIAMQREVSDASALFCARELYRSIATGLPVDEALNRVRLGLFENPSTAVLCDWFNPQLYLRLADGRLFVLDQQPMRWEQEIDRALAARNPALACDLLERSLKVVETFPSVRVRLLELVQRIAQSCIALQQWTALARLVRLAEQWKLAPDDRPAWSRLAENRRLWEEKIETPLRQAIDRGEPLEMSQAAERCERLLRGIVHDEPEALRECYGNDPALRAQFWPQDVEHLRRLRAAIPVVPLSGEALRLATALNALLQPTGWEDAEVARRIALPLARRMFAVHPVSQPEAIGQACRAVVTLPAQQGNHEGIWEQLDPLDRALLRWVLGEKSEAIGQWRRMLRGARGEDDQLRALHHLAIAHLSLAVQTIDVETRRQELRHALANFAPLVCPEFAAAKRYWSRTAADGLSGEQPLLAARQWLAALAEDLAPAAALVPSAASDSEEPAMRNMVLVSSAKEEEVAADPCGVDWQRWLDAEQAGVRLLASAAERSQLATLPVGGYTSIRLEGRNDTLRIFVRAWKARCEFDERSQPALAEIPAAAELLPDLQMAFSPLRFAWLARSEGKPPEVVAAHAVRATGMLEDSLSAPIHQALRAMGVAPPQPLWPADDDPCDAPLYIASISAEETAASACLRLFTCAYLQWCAGRLASHGPAALRIETIVETIQALGIQHVRDDELEALQEALTDWCRRHEANGRDTPLELDSLRLLARLGLTPALRACLTDRLILHAQRELDGDNFAEALRSISEALHWDPECDFARELLAYGLLGRCQALLDEGDVSQAQHLHGELADVLRRLSDENAEHRQLRERALLLEQRLESEAAAAARAVAAPVLSGPDSDLTDLWRSRIADAHAAQSEGRFATALDYLCDAASLSEGEEQLAATERAFVALAESAESVWQKIEVFVRASALLPAPSMIQQRLEELSQNQSPEVAGDSSPGMQW